MKVLVIGNGGREHALAWKLGQSRKVSRLFVAPGNAGTAVDAENVPIAATDFPELVRFAIQQHIDLTVVGPELPLTLGIVDAFEKEGLRVFGPNRRAAQMEGSKIFCKKILRAGNVPTAAYTEFDNQDDAVEYLNRNREHPVVVKADGLAAGKGVIVCDNGAEAIDAVTRICAEREFGDAGNKFIIEERLAGQEASVLAITDSKTIMTLQPAQDHKPAFDGDRGPNTGGMGAYSPAPLVDDEMLHWVESRILVPTVHTLNKNDTPFKGVLYAGLMIQTGSKIPAKVLEYNSRFGDPECQPLLMRLQTDLVDVMEAVIDQRLGLLPPLAFDSRPAVCVVMASKGYPGSCEKGFPITGIEDAELIPDVKVFHAGTTLDQEGRVVTNGGRVLGVTALGETIAEAKKRAYEAVSRIHWQGVWYRKDIADKALF
ncbi:MAG: phosphoribosylamine--glycine ligase [Thermoguttaceae bacterium]|jgi:phosphoribosylamine--glycine ligase